MSTYCDAIISIPVISDEPKEFLVAGHTIRIADAGLHAHGFGVGGCTWEASEQLAHLLESRADEIRGRRVLELGAGTGLGGIGAAVLGAEVTITDGFDNVVELAVKNCERNRDIFVVPPTVVRLKWGEATEPEMGRFDYLIGADLLYLTTEFDSLLRTLRHYLVEGTVFYLVNYKRYPDKEQIFFRLMEENGFLVDDLEADDRFYKKRITLRPHSVA